MCIVVTTTATKLMLCLHRTIKTRNLVTYLFYFAGFLSRLALHKGDCQKGYD